MLWILALLPLLLTAAVYHKLPQQIPTHWDFSGTVTYSSKPHIWLLAGLSVLMAAFYMLLPKIDPRRYNYDRFAGSYWNFGILLMGFLLGMLLLVLSESLWPHQIPVGRVVAGGLGLMYLFLGNMLPKIKNNFFMGLKNPWTLSDEDVWNRTHRLGGILLFLNGGIILGSCFWLSEKMLFGLLFCGLLFSTLIPNVMSYLWYRQKEHSK
ncbi:MAG: DUF1648 domain-containing protein [Anaerotruncus sp.]|nr:DUF1648 domain-containing protein [Anaerotruncus sp.]